MNEKVTEKNNTLTIGELAEVSGTRLTTLKYYTELGILPFSQGGKRLTRKYTEGEALERLEKIKELKETCRKMYLSKSVNKVVRLS
jgi:DNA-binding transcriptional MerR regulator